MSYKFMSRRCAICGKKSMVAVVRKKLRGKYNPTAKKRKYPNLQWVYLSSQTAAKKGLFSKDLAKEKKRFKACAKCIKTMGKTN